MLNILAAVARAGIFTAIVLLVGVAALRWLVLERRAEAAAARAAALGALAFVLLLMSLVGAFATQLVAFNLPPDPLLPDARLLLSLPWGRVWSSQVALALAGLAASAVARSGSLWAWTLATAAALALSLTPALSGHAIATEGARALAVAADGLHVLTAGTWVGTLAALAWSSPRSGPDAGAILLARVSRFSRLALLSAAVLTMTGLVGAWLHLTHVSDLWTSVYGRWLSVKLVLVAGVVAVGLFNWKRATPRLAEAGDPAALRRSIRGELLLALAVLVVTAFFVATPQPTE